MKDEAVQRCMSTAAAGWTIAMTSACYPFKVLFKSFLRRAQAECLFWAVTLVVLAVDDAAMLAMIFS